MRNAFGIILVAIFLLLSSTWVAADDIQSVTDPVVNASCDTVALGAPEYRWQWFPDYSYRDWYVQTYLKCDGTTYDQIVPGTMQVHCPSYSTMPCMAALPSYE